MTCPSAVSGPLRTGDHVLPYIVWAVECDSPIEESTSAFEPNVLPEEVSARSALDVRGPSQDGSRVDGIPQVAP